MFGNKTLYTTMKCRSMTTKEEFEKIRESVLTALNNENVKHSKIRILIGNGDSDIGFYMSDVEINELYSGMGITFKYGKELDFTLYYEDIDVIADVSHHDILYDKRND